MAESPNALPAQPTPPPISRRMHVFVTVGSTRFDSLVHGVLSEDIRDVLSAKGYNSLDVQCGNSDFDAAAYGLEDIDGQWQHATATDDGDGLEVAVWRFKPSLVEDYERAELVISHAGTSCDALCSRTSNSPVHTSRFGHHHRCPPVRETPYRRAKPDPAR